MAGKSVAGELSKAQRPATRPVRGQGRQAVKKSHKESRLVLVQKLIDKLSKDLDARVTKTGVAELIRLLAFEKELGGGQDTVREIKVTWIEPIEAELSKSE